jgi:hypothetical protein
MGLDPCRVRIPWTLRSDLWQVLCPNSSEAEVRFIRHANVYDGNASRARGKPISLKPSITALIGYWVTNPTTRT